MPYWYTDCIHETDNQTRINKLSKQLGFMIPDLNVEPAQYLHWRGWEMPFGDTSSTLFERVNDMYTAHTNTYREKSHTDQ